MPHTNVSSGSSGRPSNFPVFVISETVAISAFNPFACTASIKGVMDDPLSIMSVTSNNLPATEPPNDPASGASSAMRSTCCSKPTSFFSLSEPVRNLLPVTKRMMGFSLFDAWYIEPIALPRISAGTLPDASSPMIAVYEPRTISSRIPSSTLRSGSSSARTPSMLFSGDGERLKGVGTNSSIRLSIPIPRARRFFTNPVRCGKVS